MRHFPATLARVESDALVARIRSHFAEHGFGLWAVEVAGEALFVGFIGLAIPSFEAHFTRAEQPAVEVGWRLARTAWCRGFATEGAAAALRFGFEQLHLREIVSMTVPANERSRRVMERLGMRRRPEEDFDHPKLPVSSPLRRHVLYRLAAEDWRALAE
jgi:RimJ/RimL family protein N-acetyltransferase